MISGDGSCAMMRRYETFRSSREVARAPSWADAIALASAETPLFFFGYASQAETDASFIALHCFS